MSAVVYFVTFLFIILWVIIPLILAIVYDFYKVRHSFSREGLSCVFVPVFVFVLVCV